MSARTLYTILFFLCLLTGCLFTVFNTNPDTLTLVLKDRKLTILTTRNPAVYYTYNSNPMGLEYDLAKAFARHLGCELQVKTPDFSKQLDELYAREGDFLATGLIIPDNRQEKLRLSKHYMTVNQVVVFHRDTPGIKDVNDLNGRVVHVKEDSAHHRLLEEINRNGGSINIVSYRDIPAQALIRMVEQKQIEMTVVGSHIATVCRRYYPEIKIGFSLSDNQPISWAVRREDKKLLKEMNRFLETFLESREFQTIYDQYYIDPDAFDYVDLRTFHERIETRLPDYEAVIKRESERFGFDWPLIAAMIYQESHFDPDAVSKTGVRGIMQVTLETAKEMGIKNRLDPEESIRCGVEYLYKLYERFDDIPDDHDKLMLALASYNIGYGHVRDAQDIAIQMKKDPLSWISLKDTLPMLRKKKFYKQTRYGYARGHEPVKYVERILSYQDILKKKIIEASI
ncbi:MAG: membrane-bound lytic murein transglycosylase MltF [Proteobacteria bacterium]|nr:membrane-bound lytic murein transglycosylase MltF [Pseudomonadota bacterium]